MATQGQVVADFVRGQLLEPVAGFYTDAEILAAINAGEADFFGWVRGKDGIVETSTVAAKQTYSLPTGIMSLHKVFLNDPATPGVDNWHELAPTTLDRLTAEHPNWLSDSASDAGTPQRYMLYQDELWLHPVPDTSGLELKLFHTSIPDPLETLADYLNVDDSLVDGIKAYVLWKAWEKDKEPNRAAVEKATYQAYLGKGRRFNARRMRGMPYRIDIDSNRAFTRSGDDNYQNG